MILFYGHSENKYPSKACFSQFYPAEFKEDDNTFKWAEQYMMYHKALLFNDPISANRILRADSPFACKKLGRDVKNFDDAVWKKHRFDIVCNGTYLKFSQNELLCDYLLNTGNQTIAESTANDRIWGTGLNMSNPLATDEKCWTGRNLLGKALMKTRSLFQIKQTLCKK